MINDAKLPPKRKKIEKWKKENGMENFSNLVFEPLFATFLHRISKDRSKNVGVNGKDRFLQHFYTEFQEIWIKKLGVNGKDRFLQHIAQNFKKNLHETSREVV